jgi:hypothetical protein
LALASAIVGSAHHHVDREVVAGEHVEPGSHAVADGEAVPFESTAQRRVLRSDARRDAHHRLVRVERRDPSVGNEHLAELEADEPVDALTDRRERVDPPVIVDRVQAVRGEDHRCPATHRDRLTCAEVAVEVELVAGPIGNVGPGDERAAGDGARAVEHLRPLGVGQQLHVAGVHVDRRCETGVEGAADVRHGGIPVDLPAGRERQQYRRHPRDRSARTDPRQHAGLGELVVGSVGQMAARASARRRGVATQDPATE